MSLDSPKMQSALKWLVALRADYLTHHASNEMEELSVEKEHIPFRLELISAYLQSKV